MPQVMGVFAELAQLVTQVQNTTTAIDTAVAAYQKQATATGATWSDICGGSFGSQRSVHPIQHRVVTNVHRVGSRCRQGEHGPPGRTVRLELTGQGRPHLTNGIQHVE